MAIPENYGMYKSAIAYHVTENDGSGMAFFDKKYHNLTFFVIKYPNKAYFSLAADPQSESSNKMIVKLHTGIGDLYPR